MKKVLILACLFLAALAPEVTLAQQAEYIGFRACTKCHFDQGESWNMTAHAKAFESLKPGMKKEAKTKAKLDPGKDYTQDKNCVGCHVTGYGAPNGYLPGSSADLKQVTGVTCESCHGAGGKYRQLHADGGDRLKTKGETSERKLLAGAGQVFDMEKACAGCHLNYEGSTKHEAKAPFTPFPPSLDVKYQFDYQKSVMTAGPKNPVHTHFKLRGVFKGDPVPSVRSKLQEDAPEPE